MHKFFFPKFFEPLSVTVCSFYMKTEKTVVKNNTMLRPIWYTWGVIMCKEVNRDKINIKPITHVKISLECTWSKISSLLLHLNCNCKSSEFHVTIRICNRSHSTFDTFYVTARAFRQTKPKCWSTRCIRFTLHADLHETAVNTTTLLLYFWYNPL
jgi:hypothetical protein